MDPLQARPPEVCKALQGHDESGQWYTTHVYLILQLEELVTVDERQCFESAYISKCYYIPQHLVPYRLWSRENPGPN
jgi:hypothetical protein